jgi:nitroreductase/NAD-dependent dihydropyrimidine dehydrogenase PreA subunit
LDILEVDKETCIQDGICAAVCPSGLIDFEKGGYPKPVPEAEDVCIGCGHCVAVCPTGSLKHRAMSVEQCDPVQEELYVKPEQCEHFLKSRRSIRVYEDKPVSREDLSGLIEIARYAPTGQNSQSVEWLVLGNRDELKKFSGMTVDWMRWVIDNMPELAREKHLDNAVRRWEKGIDVVLRNAPAVIIAHGEKESRLAPTNSVIALTYLELAAAARGLGCCWAEFFNAAASTFPPLMEVMPVSEGHICFGSMMIGYPKYKYHRIPRRKAPKVTWRI